MCANFRGRWREDVSMNMYRAKIKLASADSHLWSVNKAIKKKTLSFGQELDYCFDKVVLR
jgi:peptide methionine sulfoxide reductase MsrB